MEKGRLNCVKFFNVTVIFRVEAYGYSTVHTEDVLYYNKGICGISILSFLKLREYDYLIENLDILI